jgi:ParB family protein of integrating conjugative element (PFGI_1 class)
MSNKLPQGEKLASLLRPEVFQAKSKPEIRLDERTRIKVTLNQLIPYDHNPRQSENPLYNEIKESIRNRGLDNPPHITKRLPDDKHFMIRDGGNTRLQILNEIVSEIDAELEQLDESNPETLDRRLALINERERFWEIECEFIPWKSEIDTLAGHMVENELRGGMLFVERALAVQRFRRLFEHEEGRTLSIRELTERICQQGWSVNAGDMTRYEYTTRELVDFIPDALWNGAGIDFVKRVRQLQNAIEQLWNASSIGLERPGGWVPIWQMTLSETDSEEYDIKAIQDRICFRLGEHLNVSYHNIESTLALILQNRTASAEEIIGAIRGLPDRPGITERPDRQQQPHQATVSPSSQLDETTSDLGGDEGFDDGVDAYEAAEDRSGHVSPSVNPERKSSLGRASDVGAGARDRAFEPFLAAPNMPRSHKLREREEDVLNHLADKYPDTKKPFFTDAIKFPLTYNLEVLGELAAHYESTNEIKDLIYHKLIHLYMLCAYGDEEYGPKDVAGHFVRRGAMAQPFLRFSDLPYIGPGVAMTYLPVDPEHSLPQGTPHWMILERPLRYIDSGRWQDNLWQYLYLFTLRIINSFNLRFYPDNHFKLISFEGIAESVHDLGKIFSVQFDLLADPDYWIIVERMREVEDLIMQLCYRYQIERQEIKQGKGV